MIRVAAHPTHLDLRLGDTGAKGGEAATGIELGALDDLLDGNCRSRVKTLRVVIPQSVPPSAEEGAPARLIEILAALEELTVCSTGAHGAERAPSIARLRENCRRRGLRFASDFVLDADADATAALGRDRTSLTPVLEASRALRAMGVGVRWLIPVLPELVFRLEGLFSLAQDEQVDPVLVPPCVAPRSVWSPGRALRDGERLFLWDFLSYRLLEEERPPLPPERARRYRALRDSLVDGGPPAPAEVLSVLVLSHKGNDLGAGWALRTEDKAALAPPVGDFDVLRLERYAGTRLGRMARQAAEVGSVVLDGQRAFLQWTAAAAARSIQRAGTAPAARLPSVLLIGAYGGEHIGDAAILGGVLFRVHRRYGTTRAILMSQRPAHTRHLVPMLDAPVGVTVEPYSEAKICRSLRQVDGVVFAGGPLMDLPKQLVKHLYAVSTARRQKKPLILEGIGVGPFLRWPSEWTAGRLVRMAERISVRTSADARAPLIRGLEHEVARDPAFDYLETRAAELTRLPERDRQWVDRLLKGTEGRVTVGLNLRPVRPVYTVGVSARRRAEYTRFVEARFQERLAEGMRRFHQASPVSPCFVFFPMNAIQFGSSDLHTAHRMKRLLGSDVDLRIWEGDPSIDGVVSLLRSLDVVIAMRFHAAIFALSQGRPVIGIDYRVGMRDKVAALLADFGQEGNCSRIDLMTAEWVFRRLCALSTSPRCA